MAGRRRVSRQQATSSGAAARPSRRLQDLSSGAEGWTSNPERPAGQPVRANSNAVTTPNCRRRHGSPKESGFPSSSLGAFAIGGHDLRRNQAIDREAEPAGQPAETPASVRPATPVVELMPGGMARPKTLRRLVEVCERGAGSDPSLSSSPSHGRLHLRQINDNAAVADRVTGMLCPPPRTATSKPLSRAKFTA